MASDAVTAAGTAYDVEGPEAAPAVVLIHGLGLHRGIWAHYRPALSRRYRVIAYDLLGHGGSRLLTGLPPLAGFARQIAEMLDHLDIDRAALIGFSLGGMINRRFALDFPARTSALAILNSPHERSPDQQQLVEQRAAASAEGPDATIDAALERWFTPQYRAERPDVIAAVRRDVIANDRQSYQFCRQVLATGVIELIRPSPPVDTPTLVMTCEHDGGSTPAMAVAIAGEIAAARTVIVPGLRHMGLVERPDLFVDPLLQFLGEAGW